MCAIGCPSSLLHLLTLSLFARLAACGVVLEDCTEVRRQWDRTQVIAYAIRVSRITLFVVSRPLELHLCFIEACACW